MTLTRNEDAAWDEALLSHPEATLFHTRRWARLLRSVFPRLADRSFCFGPAADPTRVPAFAWRRLGGLLTTVHSSFPFLYGGPVPGHGDRDAMPETLDRLAGAAASVRVTENPFGSRPSARPSPSGYEAHEDGTHVLPLPPTEETYWEETLSTAQRNDVRRLTKKGVSILETRDPAHVEAIYRLYRASFERWGGTPGFVYPPAFYRALVVELGDLCRTTVALHEGRVAGGTFTLLCNGRAHYLAGYFDPEARALRPNVLLQIDSIQHAIRRGCHEYDFLPSGGHASVAAFKEGLGGIRRPFTLFERRGTAHRLLDRVRPRGRSSGKEPNL